MVVSNEPAGCYETQVTHMSDVVMSVRPLDTGYSKDVHGQVCDAPWAIPSRRYLLLCFRSLSRSPTACPITTCLCRIEFTSSYTMLARSASYPVPREAPLALLCEGRGQGTMHGGIRSTERTRCRSGMPQYVLMRERDAPMMMFTGDNQAPSCAMY